VFYERIQDLEFVWRERNVTWKIVVQAGVHAYHLVSLKLPKSCPKSTLCRFQNS